MIPLHCLILRTLAGAILLSIPAGGEEITFAAPAASDALAFPLGNGRLGTLTAGKTGREIFPLIENPRFGSMDPATPGSEASGRRLGELNFEWLDAAAEVTDYRRALDLQDGLAVTTFKRGGAGFTWTRFISRPDDLLVLHLRADKPGFLSFRVGLQQRENQANVAYRRVLVLRGETKDKRSFEARAWVFPMESEVTPGEGEITVRGEGEALILIAASSDPERIEALAGRMKVHGFGVGGHPDIFRLWTDLLDRHRKRHREEMEGPGPEFERYLKAATTP